MGEQLQAVQALMARAEASVQELHQTLAGWEDEAATKIRQAGQDAGGSFAQGAGQVMGESARRAAQEVSGAAKGVGEALGSIQRQAQALEAATKAAADAIRAAQQAYELATGQERATAMRFEASGKALEIWEQQVTERLNRHFARLDSVIQEVEPKASEALRRMIGRIESSSPKPRWFNWWSHFGNWGIVGLGLLIGVSGMAWGTWRYANAVITETKRGEILADVRNSLVTGAIAYKITEASDKSAATAKVEFLDTPLVMEEGVIRQMERKANGGWTWHGFNWDPNQLVVSRAWDRKTLDTLAEDRP